MKKKQCAKSKSDPFVTVFAIGLCLWLEDSSSAIFPNILHQTEMAKPIKFLRNISLMTGLGLGGWKPTKGKLLGTYWIRGKWKTGISVWQIQRNHLGRNKPGCICRIIGCRFSNPTLERHLACHSFNSYLWARCHIRPYGRLKDGYSKMDS